MVPVWLLFAAMFTMIVIVASLFWLHLQDHEKEQIEAEDFAKTLLKRLEDLIEEKLNDEGPE